MWLGLDFGGTKVALVQVDDGGVVSARARIPTRPEDGPSALLERVVALARPFRASARAVGAGFAGLVDPEHGTVLSSIMLPGWEGTPLAAELAARLRLPARVENDATAAGWSEFTALGRPSGATLALLTVGTGIGGALVIQGELYRGRTGTAAEFGNMSIDPSGPECWCGARGCLNMLASGSAIARRGAELTGGEARTVEELAALAEAGDARAALAIEEGARALGVGVGNLINALNPDRVALAGGLTALGARWLEAVRASAARQALREPFAAATIALAAHGADASGVGAALLARDAGPQAEAPS